MSERNVGPATPRQPSPGQSAAAPPAPSSPRSSSWAEPEPTGWVGWMSFAGVMMLLLGIFHAVEGIVALVRDDYYLVTTKGLVVGWDYTTWGWIQLVLGVVVAAAAVGLFAGQTWARVVVVLVALGSAIVNLAFLTAYPAWAVIMIAIDVLVIWAVTVHGAEMRTAHERRQMYG